MTTTLRLFLLTTLSFTLSLGCGDKEETDSGTTDDSTADDSATDDSETEGGRPRGL